MSKKAWKASDTAVLVLIVTIAVLAVVGSFAYERMLWNECRDHGHTFFYCWRFISK
jgi:hypothetical protein